MTVSDGRRLLETKQYAQLADGAWILRYPAAKNPLPLNGAQGYSKQAAIVERRKAQNVREHFRLVAVAARIPQMARIRAQVTWWVATKHTRDPDNLAKFEKRAFDGLVRAGVVVDDAPRYMEKPRAEILYLPDFPLAPVTEPCFTLTVTRLDALETGAQL